MPSETTNTSSTRNQPTNPLVTALLTDLYQLTMAYAHWKTGRHAEPAVFELFFRKNPFQGHYTILAGLDECLHFLHSFQFSAADVSFLQTSVPALQSCDAGFWEWLQSISSAHVTVVTAQLDGSLCFPRVPLLTVQAPLAVGQLLETTLLTLINFPSLVATNASRMVQAARYSRPSSSKRPAPTCVEFGLRRAQGPDGGISASKYCAVGGVVGTSNVRAQQVCPSLRAVGTMAHAFIQAHFSLAQVQHVTLPPAAGACSGDNNNQPVPLLPLVLQHRQQLAMASSSSSSNASFWSCTHEGELAAFVAYAAAFPSNFLCLIDTYDTLQSGLLNFILVALALVELGYQPRGIRLDSGDLALLSQQCRRQLDRLVPANDKNDNQKSPSWVDAVVIVASNDINEDVLYELADQEHDIDMFGIGTNLVTCQKQPALGCVYKLVQLTDDQPCIKLSQEPAKTVIPGRKQAFRVYGQTTTTTATATTTPREGISSNPPKERALADVLLRWNEPVPQAGQPLLCRPAGNPQAPRIRITPTRVESLQHVVFRGGTTTTLKDDDKVQPNRSLVEARQAVVDGLEELDPRLWHPQHRKEPVSPYPVLVSLALYDYFQQLREDAMPIVEWS